MESNHPTWAALLERAVSEPGTISAAYSQFWNYSIGNQLLAWAQAETRKIPLGPMATYPRWQELGRHVRRGEKAIVLCQPVTIRKAIEGEQGDETPDEAVFTRFVYRPKWFFLAQTEGQEMTTPQIPTWDKARALAALDIREVP